MREELRACVCVCVCGVCVYVCGVCVCVCVCVCVHSALMISEARGGRDGNKPLLRQIDAAKDKMWLVAVSVMYVCVCVCVCVCVYGVYVYMVCMWCGCVGQPLKSYLLVLLPRANTQQYIHQ